MDVRNDHEWAVRLKVLGVVTFVMGWAGALIVALDADRFTEGLAVVISLGMAVSLAAAGLFGVGAYVARTQQHDL